MAPPAFGDRKYWDERFKDDPKSFEWLAPPETLREHLQKAVGCFDTANVQVLHIGCGTSLLAEYLKRMVSDPEQIHNVDYSPRAIELGRRQEMQGSSESGDGPPAVPRTMRWTVLDLLSPGGVAGFFDAAGGEFDVIVDKSTSDAISCHDEISLPSSRDTDTLGGKRLEGVDTPTASISPLRLLAVHLAILTRPGARWIAVSYSSSRFAFLDATSDHDPVDGNAGLAIPEPCRLWEMESHALVEVQEESQDGDRSFVHRPQITHYVYSLRRTDAPVSNPYVRC